MIIESGTIGMQSSRTSRTVMKASARFVGGTFAGGKEGLNSLFENQLGTGEKTAGEETDKDKANLEDLSAHMRNTAGGWQISTRNDEKEAVRSIKQQCVEFLLELLFRFRGKRSTQDNPIAAAGGTTMITVQGYQMQRYYMEEELSLLPI
ncbi:MAG: hypothetical protein K2N39_06460 [Lachnospiraceae bacterium]|nr:hypothetical protein [Lachnospiraceae bacterium]